MWTLIMVLSRLSDSVDVYIDNFAMTDVPRRGDVTCIESSYKDIDRRKLIWKRIHEIHEVKKDLEVHDVTFNRAVKKLR